jgi:hypothetical protein
MHEDTSAGLPAGAQHRVGDDDRVRPTSDQLAGARAAVKGLTADGLFDGQSPEFFRFVTRLAAAADAAQRRVH